MLETNLTKILGEKIGANHPQLAELSSLLSEYIVVRTLEDMPESFVEQFESDLKKNVGTKVDSILELLLSTYPESKENIAIYINDFMEKYV